ncbi:hypothetical protein [Nostocoides jenkinsii]|nr:hypothetical protein [Tetrasphaera jenkinsii]
MTTDSRAAAYGEGMAQGSEAALSRRTALAGIAAGGGTAVAGAILLSNQRHDVTGDLGRGSGTAAVTVSTGRVHTLTKLTSPTAPYAASRALFSTADVVVVADPGSPQFAAAVAQARAMGVPLLPGGAPLRAELDRLRVRAVVDFTAGAAQIGDRPLLSPGGDQGELLAGFPAKRTGSTVVLTTGDELPEPLATLVAAAGATLLSAPGGDPRRSVKTIAGLREAPTATVLGVGTRFTDVKRLARRVRTVRTVPLLPDGGILPLHRRRMIALYGSPLTPSLGMLGEQDAQASVARVTALTQEYRTVLESDAVFPAFELIATVAAAAPGADGTYSAPTDPADLLPWIEVAEHSGIYCVLDLQPGNADLLDQAKKYADLLTHPWVGLAIDPEWKLLPGERPLTRIGHVEIEEVNRVAAWLADLVRQHNLPPKILTLHQFQLQMIRDRDQLDLDHDELQVVVHVDGSGSQPQKQATWNVIREDLSPRIYLGWKNFEDEDSPMLTVAETVATVQPTPSFISYQ